MSPSAHDTILVTGATGFLGMNSVPVLKNRYPASKIVTVSSREFDLRRVDHCKKMFDTIRPTIVVHFAAKVGGILANKKYPVEFFNDNILINTNVFKCAFEAGVKKFVTAMGGCSYPSTAKSPISEEQMWNGFPQKESAAYSTAKKMVLIQSAAYREQYGFNSAVMIPGNVYGEYDNYSLENSHVIPAMIRKFWEAKRDGKTPVPLFGTGNPQRDFVYARDVAATLPFFIEKYDSSDPVNISSGVSTRIKDLAAMVAEFVGYKGELQWDTSKPDGQMVKIFHTRRMRELGLECKTTLAEGLRNTIRWFEESVPRNMVRM
jgi:GDP-L-fucose synthase